MSKSDKYCPQGSTVIGDDHPESTYKLPQKNPNVTRIAFVGDSITEGSFGIKNESLRIEGHNGYMTNGMKDGQIGYPYHLWEILAKNNQSDKYELLNFGFGSRFSSDVGNINQEWNSNSYLQSCDFLKAVESEAQIYVVMLGTNDILHESDAIDKSHEIKQGYSKIINAFKYQKHGPEIYLMIPPAIVWERIPKKENNIGAGLSTIWLQDLIKDVAKAQDVKDDHIINLQEVITLNNIGEYLHDFVHPSDKGYAAIAEKVYSALFNKDKKK